MVKIILLVIGGCVFVLLAAMVVVPKVTGTAGNITEVGETYSYTVEGEVSKPGTYTLSDAVTMLDLITAAGGTVYNTDELSYFDDAKLT
ncbi:MAG: SLBB domain-containing protein, partial [Bacilli bacterium]|nr:SLBB domain-containing protein [Bacilli bacterium]